MGLKQWEEGVEGMRNNQRCYDKWNQAAMKLKGMKERRWTNRSGKWRVSCLKRRLAGITVMHNHIVYGKTVSVNGWSRMEVKEQAGPAHGLFTTSIEILPGH